MLLHAIDVSKAYDFIQHTAGCAINRCFCDNAVIESLGHLYRPGFRADAAGSYFWVWLLGNVTTKHAALAVSRLLRWLRRHRVDCEEGWGPSCVTGHLQIEAGVEVDGTMDCSPIGGHESLKANLVAQDLDQRVAVIVCSVIWVTLLLSTPSFGQLSTASVNGVVRDPSRAVIAKAKILLRNVDTSVGNTTETNGSGAYAFLNIQPGRYTIEATAPGFKHERLSVFTLTVSQVAAIDFSLEVGGTTSEITVQETAPLLEVASASLGTEIGTKQVDDLPLNGRNFTELLLLSPGVSSANTSQNSSGFAS